MSDTDHRAKTLDLGYAVSSTGSPGLFVHDAKDLVERTVYSLRLRPAGEVGCDRIHHLDPPIGSTGNDAISDGGERRSQALFRLKDLFGATAQNFERDTISRRDGIEPATSKQTDEDTHAESDGDERFDHVANLDDATAESCRIGAPRCGA